jgi:hypothetical protein
MKEALEVQGLDALLAAGRRLQEVNPDAFAKVLAAARAFVAIYERPDEPEEVFVSRLQQINPKGPRVLD